MLSYLILLLLSSVLVDAAPHKHKSKNKKYDGPQLVYDQKQTGDYNIQVHLKDFQIIAMLGDDILGDYDYNYDYADFTIKPSTSTSTSTSTTSKPTSTTLPPSTTQKESPSTSQLPISSSSESSFALSDLMLPEVTENSNSSEKPSTILVSNAHSHPLEVIVPQPLKKPEDNSKPLKRKGELIESITDNVHTHNGLIIDANNGQDLTLEAVLNLVSTFKPSSTPSSFSSPSTPSFSSSPPSNPPSTLPALPQPSPSPGSPPGKIKVQILGVPPSIGLDVSSGGVVPGEEVKSNADGSILHSELASYRRCSTGYARDKRGRCRRVRKPGLSSQLPYGFSRFASNLATRLRLTPQESPTVTSTK